MTATPKPPQPDRAARPTDETTVGMVAASEKRLNRKVRNLACLVVIAGASMGEKIALAKDRYLIGRQADADICFDDALVSRQHAEIMVGADSVVIRDLGSRNGTYCNEQKIADYALQDGDLIWIGSSVLKYVAPDSAESLYVNVMSERARLDALTGLLNRRTLEDYLDWMFQRCRALHEPLSVVMVDVDHFKRVNDQWGHSTGDFVIKEIAARFKDGFRPTDLLARYGGEEFGLILPYTNEQEACTVGERIRTAVVSDRFMCRDQPIQVTISVGIAQSAEDMETPSVLIDRADRALYAAKQGGRNRTCSFSAL